MALPAASASCVQRGVGSMPVADRTNNGSPKTLRNRPRARLVPGWLRSSSAAALETLRVRCRATSTRSKLRSKPFICQPNIEFEHRFIVEILVDVNTSAHAIASPVLRQNEWRQVMNFFDVAGGPSARVAVALAAVLASTGAYAMELDLGESDWQGRFDNTIKGGLMYRTRPAEPALVNSFRLLVPGVPASAFPQALNFNAGDDNFRN